SATQLPSTKALAITSRITRGASPPPLMGSAIVLVNDSALHCFGGRLEDRELTNCHYVLDGRLIQGLSFRFRSRPIPSIPTPPCPRYFHTLNAYGTSLILFGGMGSAQVQQNGEDSDNEGDQPGKLAALDDLHVFDIVTQRWQQKHPRVNEHTPRARWAHMATILDHYLIVIGGTDTVKAYVEDACILDLHTWEWVASVRNIGQCGSYRTIAATGPSDSIKKTSVRLKSGELTPAFNAGTDMPSIYLYSNYNFQNLQREFKVIAPQYSPSLASSTPTGYELPPGLRFPQGHVYQNQLILTGTLIVPGKAPTLAIYSFSLSLNRWEKLDTDTSLLTGSWNRTILHPATGTLLIFGNRESNAEIDYSTRIQHHHHLMMINLQAYGLYERPVPSFLRIAQDLGEDLLRETGLSDMHLASATGTLFDANSTILAGRWPEFATMLLSPPYVTPLILVLPVPDEVIPVFLHYLYTGALPQNALITPGIADYLLILARRYQLNGLHALTLDVLHQAVITNPMRVYNSALMAGELGLQARAVGLAMFANRAAQSGQDQPPPLPPAPR
ncbi:hypothetical protein BC939DRAFT_389158, partial [Gamsiella multidivaricata]|uniref:uncharacterized protein n=1 Tax=Gamsiella multidivaricata TaxID=101098 RepID=UPI00221F0EBE